MLHPVVSIVLPTFNGAGYLRNAIESCLNQTFEQFELIIVNDCSTDETLAIAKEYAQKDERIRIISNEENKKLPLSLNAGFSVAKGTYYTWTSDDNIYAPNAIATLVGYLEQNPSIDLVYTDYQLINASGKVFSTRSFGDVNKSFTKWTGAGACFLYKKEIHTALKGYNAAAFLVEDYDFFIRAFIRFNFAYLPTNQLYFYREHEGSLTSQHLATVNDMAKIFLERNLAGLEQRLQAFDLALLYRKLAVFYGSTKSVPYKYMLFLQKLKRLSVPQALVVLCYVPVSKMVQMIRMSFTGIKALLLPVPKQ
ncbi:glycosyltransferase family 2 protein [Paracnuella aquatica]|uniref:glycosyltransferase family 2 protein n=1 Tax=Paracnuella aquatica TaxID=2268757 RepID=UPI000DEFECF4|nr:glycosyltransferase family A protein [Paracnuella aquatica]RPD51328.1 glycosyltransferase family 2 protein [Paracnuella aquatica]